MTLKQFSKNIQKLNQTGIDEISEIVLREMTLRFLTKVIQLTPVGKSEGGYVGGTLRRGWIIKNQSYSTRFLRHKYKVNNQPTAKEIESFVKGLKFKKVGKIYKIKVVNPVHYAKYVNYGHRKRRRNGHYGSSNMQTVIKKGDWVQGYFFLEKAERYINNPANYNKVFKILFERELKRRLGL